MPKKPVYEVVAHQEGRWWVFDVPALSSGDVAAGIGAMGQSESWERVRSGYAVAPKAVPASRCEPTLQTAVDLRR